MESTSVDLSATEVEIVFSCDDGRVVEEDSEGDFDFVVLVTLTFSLDGATAVVAARVTRCAGFFCTPLVGVIVAPAIAEEGWVRLAGGL